MVTMALKLHKSFFPAFQKAAAASQSKRSLLTAKKRLCTVPGKSREKLYRSQKIKRRLCKQLKTSQMKYQRLQGTLPTVPLSVLLLYWSNVRNSFPEKVVFEAVK